MGEKYGHSCFEFIAGKFKNSVSGIAPVFIEIHDNSLDVARFIHKTLKSQFSQLTHSQIFSAQKLGWDSVIFYKVTDI